MECFGSATAVTLVVDFDNVNISTGKSVKGDKGRRKREGLDGKM
jgi:hypothetical protein